MRAGTGSSPRAARRDARAARSRRSGAPAAQVGPRLVKGSVDEAEAYWTRITTRFPELDGYQKTITPAVVRSKQYSRLRATGPDARAVCSTMKQSGADCFPVS